MVYRTTRPEDRKQVDAVASQLAEVGIRVLPKPSDESAVEAMLNGGTFNAILKRENFTNPTDKTCRHLPISDKCPLHHQAGDQPRDTMDFEVELGALYADFLATSAPAEKIQIVQRMQELLTQNVYTIGTIQTPAALLVNKRIRNAHPGTPVFLFQWAEDGVIRERLWTAKADQLDEILPGTIAEY